MLENVDVTVIFSLRSNDTVSRCLFFSFLSCEASYEGRKELQKIKKKGKMEMKKRFYEIHWDYFLILLPSILLFLNYISFI